MEISISYKKEALPDMMIRRIRGFHPARQGLFFILIISPDL